MACDNRAIPDVPERVHMSETTHDDFASNWSPARSADDVEESSDEQQLPEDTIEELNALANADGCAIDRDGWYPVGVGMWSRDA